MKLKTLLLLSLALIFTYCNKKEDTGPQKESVDSSPQSQGLGQPPAPKTGYTGKVLETMNSGGYTYVQLDMDNGNPIWIAGPQTTVVKGETVQTTSKGSLMENFASKSLNRTFEKIYFVDAIVKPGNKVNPHDNPHGSISKDPQASYSSEPVSFKDLKPLKGGSTIEAIFKDKANLVGKEVSLRAKVVKANFNILNTNWYHLQDGTGKSPANDLTITSDEKIAVGDKIIAKGKVITDKDFGAGYSYDVMIEKASITVEK